MKTVFFYILLAIILYLIFSIATILINDFERLTEYGFGFLTGQIILFIVLGFIAYKIKPKL